MTNKPLYKANYGDYPVHFLGSYGDSDFYLRINQVNEVIIDKRYGNTGLDYSNWWMDIIEDHYEGYENFDSVIPKEVYNKACELLQTIYDG